MILTAARISEALLACMAIFVAVRSPRHRLFAGWITYSLCYSLIDHLWIQPTLGHLPRPFGTTGRMLLHTSQALLIALNAGFASVAFNLVRKRRILRPIPWFLGFIALVFLIDGYGHSPGPGLYQVMSHTFRSRDVYRPLELVLHSLALGAILLPWRTVSEECLQTDDVGVLGSVLAIGAAGMLNVTAALFPNALPPYSPQLSLLLAYAIAIGFHAPLVYMHILGEKSPSYIFRQATAMRREAIYEMGTRVEASRAAFAAIYRDGQQGPRSFPTAVPLANYSGLSHQFLALVLEDRVSAGCVEFVLSTVCGLPAADAVRLLSQIDAEVQAGADDTEDLDEEFPWLEMFERSKCGPKAFHGQIAMIVFGMLRGMSWRDARKVFRLVRLIAEGVARQQNPKKTAVRTLAKIARL